MTNLERLKMEIKGIEFPDNELSIYLQENGLNDKDKYQATDNLQKRKIHLTALSVLESLANDPSLMKNYKQDDITISQFHENLLSRIDQLERKIRQMSITDKNSESDYFMLFSK